MCVYEEAGIRSYWIVDPKVASLTVLELADGSYADVAVATGVEVVDVVRPFPLRLVPADLVR